MNPEEISSRYILNDGTLKSFSINLSEKEALIELDIRKPLPKGKWQTCSIQLRLTDVNLVNIFEDFPTDGGYTDITFLTNADGLIYLSLDPHGNSNEPHEDDNWVIKASKFSLIELP